MRHLPCEYLNLLIQGPILAAYSAFFRLCLRDDPMWPLAVILLRLFGGIWLGAVALIGMIEMSLALEDWHWRAAWLRELHRRRR